MPIYEFKCESCSHIDEILMKISDPAPEKCSVCGKKVHKIMSKSSFSLKGTGWYATDYKNTAANPPEQGQDNKPVETTENAKPAETTDAKKANTETTSSIPAAASTSAST